MNSSIIHQIHHNIYTGDGLLLGERVPRRDGGRRRVRHVQPSSAVFRAHAQDVLPGNRSSEQSHLNIGAQQDVLPVRRHHHRVRPRRGGQTPRPGKLFSFHVSVILTLRFSGPNHGCMDKLFHAHCTL